MKMIPKNLQISGINASLIHIIHVAATHLHNAPPLPYEMLKEVPVPRAPQLNKNVPFSFLKLRLTTL